MAEWFGKGEGLAKHITGSEMMKRCISGVGRIYDRVSQGEREKGGEAKESHDEVHIDILHG